MPESGHYSIMFLVAMNARSLTDDRGRMETDSEGGVISIHVKISFREYAG